MVAHNHILLPFPMRFATICAGVEAFEGGGLARYTPAVGGSGVGNAQHSFLDELSTSDTSNPATAEIENRQRRVTKKVVT